MKVLILGANGMLGPHVVKALEGRHELRLTDINDLDSPHEYFKVYAGDIDQVVSAAEGDGRNHQPVSPANGPPVGVRRERPRLLQHDGGGRGARHRQGHKQRSLLRSHRSHLRTVRPHDRTGRSAPAGDVPVRVDQVAWTGDLPRSLPSSTTSTSWTCCSTCSSIAETDNAESGSPIANVGHDLVPYAVSWRDAGECFRCALEVDFDRLPSKCEVFFVFPDLPHQKFTGEKARRIFGWTPQG